MFNKEQPFWELSEKIFLPYLDISVRTRPLQFYGKSGEILFSSPEIEQSNIYFIVEDTKVRFVPEKTIIRRNGIMKVVFRIANKHLIKHKIDLARLFLGNKMPNNFKSVVIGASSQNAYLKRLKRRKHIPLTGLSINQAKSNGNCLFLNIYTPNLATELPPLTPHVLMDLQKIKVSGFPNILYIGQSQQIKKRTSSHEKIQRALSEARDDKDIFVYFFKFSVKQVVLNKPEDLIQLLKHPHADNIKDEGRLNLVEMALINYFKPRYNSTFVESNISSNQQVEQLLKANGFSQMITEINFDDESWFFGSDHVRPNSKHLIVHKLSDNNSPL